MASLEALQRVNPQTGKMEEYWRIVDRARDGTGRWRKQVTTLGFIPKQSANKALKVYEGRKAAGMEVLPATPPPSSAPTLQEWWPRFMSRIRADGKANATVELAEMMGRSLLRGLGELRLDAVNQAAVDGYLASRREGGVRARTMQIELRHLLSALRLAAEEGEIEAAPSLKMPTNNNPKPHVFLTPEQSEQLLTHLPWEQEPASAVAIYAALETGCRRGELLSRQWRDVRWDQGPGGALWVGERVEAGEVVWTTKTRRGRTIPLSSGLREVLLWWRERSIEAREKGRGAKGEKGKVREDAWVFPSPNNGGPLQNFRKALASACQRAGVPEIHPHALRHTWATRLAMRGIPRAITMALGGWRSPEILEGIYQHATDGFAVAAVEAVSLGAKPLRQLTGAAPARVPQTCPSGPKPS